MQFKLFQHPIAERVSRIALKIFESMVKFFNGVPQFNLAVTESNEFENWFSQYIHDINGHSGVATPLHAACWICTLPRRFIREDFTTHVTLCYLKNTKNLQKVNGQ